MKKASVSLLCLLLVFSLCLGLSGCDKTEKQPEKTSDVVETTPVPSVTPEISAADPETTAPPEETTAEPQTATETPAPTEAPTAEPTAEPITVSLQYDGAKAGDLSFQTATVFQLQAVTSDGSSGGSWTSSDASVASVDLNGVVTCYKAGTARITYTQGEASASCNLTITEPTVYIYYGADIKSDITLKSDWGFEIDLTAVVTPEGSPVNWTSDDTSIATVDANGHVTAKRMGTTTIHAKCGTADAFCIVRVMENPPTYVAPTPDTSDGKPRLVITFWGIPNDDFTIGVGTSVQMSYILYNVEGNPAVTWSIQDPDYASVDANGIVTGLKPTKDKGAYNQFTKLIATCGDLKCECIVRVKEAEAPI